MLGFMLGFTCFLSKTRPFSVEIRPLFLTLFVHLFVHLFGTNAPSILGTAGACVCGLCAKSQTGNWGGGGARLYNSSFWIQNSSFLKQNSLFWIHNSSFLMQKSSFLLTGGAWSLQREGKHTHENDESIERWWILRSKWWSFVLTTMDSVLKTMDLCWNSDGLYTETEAALGGRGGPRV